MGKNQVSSSQKQRTNTIKCNNQKLKKLKAKIAPARTQLQGNNNNNNDQENDQDDDGRDDNINARNTFGGRRGRREGYLKYLAYWDDHQRI